MDIVIRKARIKDTKEIKAILDYYAKRGKVLPRAFSEIYENIRDFYVAEKNGKILGCCALHVLWEDLAEIRSLAIRKNYTMQGAGTMLVDKCLSESKDLGVKKIFTLTFCPGFFKKCGFKKWAKSDLPQKIWTDCIKCPHFPECGEEAMLIEI